MQVYLRGNHDNKVAYHNYFKSVKTRNSLTLDSLILSEMVTK